MLIAVGTNHKYSRIELREKLSFSKKRLNEALLFLSDYTGLKGAVILSTCNRVEVYASCEDVEYGLESVTEFLSRYHEIDSTVLTPYLYKYVDIEAVRHLFRVSSGLDSQVLGETQVLGQVKYFYEEAKRLGFADDLLKEIFDNALEIGKRVRAETDISKGNVSIGSAAVSLIKDEVGELKEKKILIIGLGKISGLVIKYLLKEGVKAVLVSNRTYERAKEIAESIGLRAVRFDELRENLKGADIIISATSSPHIILKKDDILTALNYRPSTIDHRLLIIDLAVPRDVDPKVRDIESVKLFDIDDLTAVIEKNLERRKTEIPKAEDIIRIEADKIWRILTRSIELEHGAHPLP